MPSDSLGEGKEIWGEGGEGGEGEPVSWESIYFFGSVRQFIFGLTFLLADLYISTQKTQTSGSGEYI